MRFIYICLSRHSTCSMGSAFFSYRILYNVKSSVILTMPFIAFQEKTQLCLLIACSGLGSQHWKGLTHTISDSPLEDRQTQSHSQGFLPLFLKYLLTTEKGVDPSLLFLLVCSQWQIKGERALNPGSFLSFFFFYMKDFIVLPPQLTAGPRESSKRSRKREGLLTYFQSAGSGWIEIHWYAKEDPCYIPKV